jgi:hypothetical protein
MEGVETAGYRYSWLRRHVKKIQLFSFVQSLNVSVLPA